MGKSKLPKCGERDFAPDWWKENVISAAHCATRLRSGVEE